MRAERLRGLGAVTGQDCGRGRVMICYLHTLATSTGSIGRDVLGVDHGYAPAPEKPPTQLCTLPTWLAAGPNKDPGIMGS